MDDFCACSPDKRAEERRRAAQNFLGAMLDKPKSPFWRFARFPREIGFSVLWTNLAKVGVIEGNPRGKYLKLQTELACRTLRAEIKEYKPSLVFLVSGEYATGDIVFPVFGDSSHWNKLNNENYWWQVRTEEMPPIVWTYHPQGRYGQKEEWDKWTGQAKRLIGESC